MIAKLKGFVDTVGEDFCIIDVNGVGYLVFASAKTLGRLQKSQAACLMIETVVREDSISLYGFYDAWEKEWFTTLTKVQGVGSKVCLNILSVLSPSQLSQAISAKDAASFTRANGVGPKLAARIVTELKDKIVTVPAGEFAANKETAEEGVYGNVITMPSQNSSVMEDAVSALVNLGYQRLEAYRAVNKILAEKEESDVSVLIRLSLKEFAKD